MSTEFLLSIPAMKCRGCVVVIDKALSSHAGVISVEVDLATKKARVVGVVPLSELIEVLKNAGFDASGNTGNEGGIAA
jgi:copper chaperone CopZ